jgi:NADP-dependent 3-hydroxy acid dehydrogenase YdfG
MRIDGHTPIFTCVYTLILDMVEDRISTKRIALVTGSSSGIGYETAPLLARNGFYTFASMRNMDKSKEITDIANK